jgi:phage terminase small subunit
MDTITKLSSEFGFTPASRARLQAGADVEGIDQIEGNMCGP